MYYYSPINSRSNMLRIKNCFTPINTYVENTARSPMAKLYKKEESELLVYCLKNSLSMFVHGNHIDISSPCGHWKLTSMLDGTLSIYHKNETAGDTDENSPIPGYHLHSVKYSSAISYFKYITDHDYSRLSNPFSAKTRSNKSSVKKRRISRIKKLKESIIRSVCRFVEA